MQKVIFFLENVTIYNWGVKFSEEDCVPLEQRRLLYAVFGNSKPVAAHQNLGQFIKFTHCDPLL